MSRDDRLSATEILSWVVLGVGAGLAAGFVLGEWTGGVNPARVRGAARRLREGSPLRLTPAASVRAVEAALQAEPRLQGLSIEVVSFARGVVELRGWVPTRFARAIAGRTALAAQGIESVINSILVHGEDDQPMRKAPRATDQSA
ncbi:MAG TPA: BON domain-containing protein [Gemmatimonadales bacterium]